LAAVVVRSLALSVFCCSGRRVSARLSHSFSAFWKVPLKVE
jgi:hypothetical protein